MMRIKKRAYIVTLIIIAAFTYTAYYSYLQSKHLQLNFDDSATPPLPIKKQETAPAENTTASNSPQPVPPPIKPLSASGSSKIETFIIEADIYFSRPDKISVTKGNKINLLITPDKYRSGEEGMEFRSDFFDNVKINPGITKTITFIADSDFTIQVFDAKSGEKLPPAIYIDVK